MAANFDTLPDTLPSHFEDMDRDMQWKVLKHTGARFEVEHKSKVEPAQILLPNDIYWPYYVPVIVRYEFRLLPRRASGPEMIAKFTLFLDQAIREKPEWGYMVKNAQHKAIFDRPGAYIAHEFEPFSQLSFYGHDDSYKLFCFVRIRGEHRSQESQHTEVALPWTRFDNSVLTQVREQMQDKFHLPLTELAHAI